MRRVTIGLALTFLMLICGLARADVTFTVSGQFGGNGGLLTGEFTVDDSGNIVENSVGLDYLPIGKPELDFYNLIETIVDGSAVTLQVTNGGTATGFGLVVIFTGPLGNPTLGPITGGFVFGFQPGVPQTFPDTCTAAFLCVARDLVGTIAAVPEPATLALLGLGLAGLGFARRKNLHPR